VGVGGKGQGGGAASSPTTCLLRESPTIKMPHFVGDAFDRFFGRVCKWS